MWNSPAPALKHRLNGSNCGNMSATLSAMFFKVGSMFFNVVSKMPLWQP